MIFKLLVRRSWRINLTLSFLAIKEEKKSGEFWKFLAIAVVVEAFWVKFALAQIPFTLTLKGKYDCNSAADDRRPWFSSWNVNDSEQKHLKEQK